jgi:hypothetical protein
MEIKIKYFQFLKFKIKIINMFVEKNNNKYLT